jgi:GntR family transcriptional regulator, carbon starvation induced regulator
MGVPTETSSKSLTTTAFERLRADILVGDLLPNARLKIHGLSERYQIGTTAIREALSRLVTDGLVASEDLRGFTVAPVSREELVDLTQTRIQVESLALGDALQKGDVEWESLIIADFHRLSKTAVPMTPALHAPWELAHRRFHRSLIAGCNSPSLLRLCVELYDKSERYRNLAERYTSPKIRDTDKEHSDLMEAVLRRDVETSRALLAAHLWTTTNIILQSPMMLAPG